jgi:hypothetical protein
MAALMYWFRRAELSADRAAAVALGGPQSVVESMVRLASGPKDLTANVDLGVYDRQAEEYDKLLENDWDRLVQGYGIMFNDHPYPSVRCREIRKWCQSDHFRRLMAAAERPAPSAACPRCGHAAEPEWKFCMNCGAPRDGAGGKPRPSPAAPKGKARP